MQGNNTQSNQVVPFFFEQHQVRVSLSPEGEPNWFAQDLAELLGYSSTGAMLKHVDKDDKKTVTIQNGTTYLKQSLINESGLYSVVFGSTLDSAKYFKRWVTNEVLPSIRKIGGYGVSQMPKTSLKDELFFLREATKILRLPESAVQNGMVAISKKYGLEQTYLPSYSKSEFKRAMGDLLKDHGSDLTAVRVNPILIRLGILEEVERRSSNGSVKKFKSLTEKGLEYGENEQARQNTHETQPRYYVDKFPDLLDLIHDNIDILKVKHLEVVQ